MNTATVQNGYITVTFSKKVLIIGAGIVLLLAGALLAGHIAGHIPVALLAR